MNNYKFTAMNTTANSNIATNSTHSRATNNTRTTNTTTNTNNNNNNNNTISSNISASSGSSTTQQTNSGSSTTTNIINSSTNNNNNNNNVSIPGQPQTAVNGGSLSDSLASTDSHKTPNVEALSKTNLYIRGLQSNTSDQDLYNMCREFGQISSTKSILDKTTGCCRGYGFVEFTEPRSAELAVQELTKSGVQAQMAKISSPYLSHHNQHHHHQHHHHQHHHHHHNNNNHHHNFNQNHHSSNSSSSNNNNNNNNSSGSSTINNSTATNNSNNSGTNHQLNHNPSSSNNHADPTNLYIANLPPNMSEQELENLLSTYGPVVSTRILRDQSNIPRGVGFARMESREKCKQIIAQLNGRPYKGWKEPLLVKFADGGNKKRHQNNHQHHHHQHQNQHHNNNHQHHQEDSRWRDNSNASDLSSVSSFDHQSNISHSNHLPDLAMIGPMSYPRMQPGFPPNVAPGTSYPAPMVPPTSAPQWIHPGAPGQPPLSYVISQQMLQAGGLGPSTQAAALHYGHIPQLASQMQSLQIGPPGAPVGGYLPPQHQWSALWTHPIHPQPQSSMRLPLPMQQPPLPPLATQQQPPPQTSPQPTPVLQHQPPPSTPQQQQSPANESQLQVNVPL